jgi:hypothetical protein
MKSIPIFPTAYAKTLDDYAVRVARWAMHQLKLNVDEATKLINAFPTAVERAWNQGAEPQSVPQYITSHVRWLAELDEKEGKLDRSKALNRLYFFLAFPRLRKRKETMPSIP